MADILIERETEIDQGWLFEVVVTRPGAGEARFRVRLSWADYNLWSGGRMAPERVARAAVRYMLERSVDVPIDRDFDLATLRLRRHGIDRELPRLLD